MGNKQSAVAPAKETILAFDLYDTILDTASIKDALGEQFGKYKGSPLATLLRRFQLEYTWRMNSMKQYRPLPALTRDALIQTLDDYPLTWSDGQIDAVMSQYDKLSTLPGVSEALESLANVPNVVPVIFSNGTPEMIASSIENAPDLKPHASVFKKIVTADGAKKFKPDPDLYYHLAEEMGVGKTKEEMGRIWLITANSFDVVGARAVGINTVWIRSGQVPTWTDKMVEGDDGKPLLLAQDIKDAVAQIATKFEVKAEDKPEDKAEEKVEAKTEAKTEDKPEIKS